MRYINITTLVYPIKLEAIRKANPSTAFPDNPTDEQLAPFHYATVTPVIRPDYNSATHKVNEITPVFDGVKFSQTWEVVTLTQEELDRNLAQAQTDKAIEMKLARDEMVNGTTDITTTLGNTFVVDVNVNNRSNMHQASTNAANAGFPDTDTLNWKMGDNTYQTVTYGELKEIGLQLGGFIETQFVHEATKLVEIETCGTDITCVNAISW